MIKPRLVVTGHRPDGASAVVVDQLATSAFEYLSPDLGLAMLWGTPDGGAEVGGPGHDPTVAPVFPGNGGTRMLLIRWEPQGAEGPPVPAAGRAATAAAATPPHGPSTPDGSSMHATDTIDYGICLEGELYLELDDGEEVKLSPGTLIVQRGTRHAWHNRSDLPALTCHIVVGAARTQH